jgi:hypothetical protein
MNPSEFSESGVFQERSDSLERADGEDPGKEINLFVGLRVLRGFVLRFSEAATHHFSEARNGASRPPGRQQANAPAKNPAKSPKWGVSPGLRSQKTAKNQQN